MTPRRDLRDVQGRAVCSWETYRAVPAFDGESTDPADAAESWHRLYRKEGWRSSVARWGRPRKT